ncbi:MAG: diversity-generating retroelement protein Avd [Bacteriovoracales bacterium]|nr:diversity-generating retroelement protein Avd [Bacteriovoracales bacterium]
MTQPSRGGAELPLFVKWLEFLKWLFPTLDKFPKKSRFTVAIRLQNMALDIVDLLVESKYSREKIARLKKVNLHLEKMRILLRISHEIKLMPAKSYHFAMKQINEAGMMVGGWIREREKR